MSSPVAMVSYSWADQPTADLLHDELAMRCFDVVHDRYSFGTGQRIAPAMASGVDRCDVFLPYLTPNSLYLDRSVTDPRPALDGELLPALRRRRSNLHSGAVAAPIVIPIAHGLGDRDEANELLRSLTGEDFASLWGPWPDQHTPALLQPEAADFADRALATLLADTDLADHTVEVEVATRGDTPAARRFTVDATRLVGVARRPGTPGDWARIVAALNSTATTLTRCGGKRVHISLNCHLSAAYATGRTFHQATRWLPLFATRHGDSAPATSIDGSVMQGALDPYGHNGDLVADIDLLGHSVAAATDHLATTIKQPGGRLSLTANTSDDLSASQIAASARDAAHRVRQAVATLRPERLHLTMAAPAAFAALLGHHSPALSAAVTTYEFDGRTYQPAAVISPAAP